VRDRAKALKLIGLVAQGPKTTAQLMERLSVKERHFRNLTAEARRLGAAMVSRQMETNENGKLTGPYYWEVENLSDIRALLEPCLTFETTGSLSRRRALEDPTLWNELINGEQS